MSMYAYWLANTGLTVHKLTGLMTEGIGAEEIGMDFLAVLYGWGFRTKEETVKYKCRGTVAAPAEIVPRVLAL